MVSRKIGIILLAAGLTLASLVGCSSDAEQSPAAENKENTSVESQQEETLTSEEESSSDEISKETIESSTQASETSTDETEDESEDEQTEEIDIEADSAYTWEEWLGEDGHLYYPFDQDEDTSDWQWSDVKARYVIPEQALENAQTIDLVTVCNDASTSIYSPASLYNDAAQMLYNFLQFNAASELLERDDMARTVLEVYKDSDYVLTEDISEAEGDGITAEEAVSVETAIVRMELFLASDEAFDQMTDEEKMDTLDAILEKYEHAQSGEYYVSRKSAFASLVCELGNTDYGSEYYDYLWEGSKWYDYIQELAETEDGAGYAVLTELDAHSYWMSY